jgi:predicted NAD/FAD-binding protein
VDRVAHVDARVSLDVVVIGAGWAGLAAAVALTEAGRRVEVLEAAPVAGGRARRVAMHGLPLDNGHHLLIGAYRDTLALLEQVGAPRDGLMRLPLTLHIPGHVDLRGAALPAPLSLGVGLLRAAGLNWRERLAAVRLLTGLQRARFRTRPGETAAQLFARHAQPARLVHLLWAPLTVAALNTEIEHADAQVLATVLRDALCDTREASDFLLPARDLGALLPEPATRWLEARGQCVRTACPVRAIARLRRGDSNDAAGNSGLSDRGSGSRGAGDVGNGDSGDRRGGRNDSDTRESSHCGHRDAGDGSSHGFVVDHAQGTSLARQVIVATDPARAAPLLRAFVPLATTADALADMPQLSIVSVYLQYPAHVTLPGPLLGSADAPAQWWFDRGRIAGQRGLIGAVISAATAHAGVPQPELVDAAHAQLARVVRELCVPQWSQVIHEKRATFACVPGVFRPSVRTAVDGLWLAGDYTAGDYPATLEGAVRSGREAARCVLEATSRAGTVVAA